MYSYKKIYKLDFSNIKYLGEVHQIIKKEFDFPDYYGENWYAFWDCLTDMIGEEMIIIELYGYEHLQTLFPSESEIMLDILKDFKHWSDNKYSDKIIIAIVCGENAKYYIR